jgi:hypothetical protein
MSFVCRLTQVLAEMFSKRSRKILKRHPIICPVGHAEQGLCEREFVGGDVSPE